MKLHKILKSNTGFTLIEIVVVVGIVLCVSAMTLVFDIRSLVFASVDEEVELFTNLVFKAQHRSMISYKNSVWGIHTTEDTFILFSGDTAEGALWSEVFARNKHIQMSTSSDITFQQHSGFTEEHTRTFSNGVRQIMLHIYPNGVVDIDV